MLMQIANGTSQCGAFGRRVHPSLSRTANAF